MADPGTGRAAGRPPTFQEAPATYVVVAVLLAAALVALLYVGSYAHNGPTLFGFPFFYWYSIMWLLLNAIAQVIAYQLLVVRRRDRAARS